ncbi:MAG: LPS-assembly protein LptD [Burkholderiales bacterium]
MVPTEQARAQADAPWSAPTATTPTWLDPGSAPAEAPPTTVAQAEPPRSASASPFAEPQLPTPRLKTTPQLRELLPGSMRKSAPTFVYGDKIRAQTDIETTLEGNAEIRRGDMVIRADHLEYEAADDLAKAKGSVYLNRSGNVYQGPRLELKMESFEGFFENPRYRFLANNAYGEAERAVFIDDKRVAIEKATYSTCRRQPGPSWMPAWVFRADKLNLDLEEDTGVAEGARLEFKGVETPRMPKISFPLSEKRKSGWLPPTVLVDNLSGVELMVPYYWDIAPNRDATFYPSVKSRRGVELGGEFRYLENGYRGQARANYMPYDILRERERWGYSLQHNGGIDTGIAAIGGLGLNLNLNRVSDDNYWRDFPRGSPSLVQRLLSNDGSLNWAQGNFTTTLRATKWQTLQAVDAPIVPPYDRLPQLAARYARLDVGGGFDFSLDGDYTRFSAGSPINNQPNAQRSFSLAQVSYPSLHPGWFITPKAQLHATHYDFDGALANGTTSADRIVPTFSLDGGLIFERDASIFGRAFRQTLEPRAFYVYTPYRDQSLIPIYDTAPKDFNFASIYTENSFVGNDRIADNNLLTLGVTTRLFDPQTGAEAARFGIAQRLRFKDQNVTLPGVAPVTDRFSDLLLGTTINWTQQWRLDSTVQYNEKLSRSERITVGGRYTPSDYRSVSAAYRLQRDLSESIDVGWQWPLNDLFGDRGSNLGPGQGQGPGRWYSVGRLNYSMQDKKLVDGVVGFEYDGGCWLGRIVFERLQHTTSSANTRVMFQLEFVGFSRIGSSPLQILKANVPRYQFLREQTLTPSRFGNYD